MIKIILIALILYLILSQQKKPTLRNSQPANNHENPFEVLGISSSATEEEIRQAFKEQTKKNHPDLVANMSKEFHQLAEEKIKKINWAYSEIRKLRGF